MYIIQSSERYRAMCKRPILRNVQETNWVTILSDNGKKGNAKRLYFESTYSPKINKKEKWFQYLSLAKNNNIDVLFTDVVGNKLDPIRWHRKKNEKWCPPFNILKIIHLIIKDKNKLRLFNEKFEPIYIQIYENKQNENNDDDDDDDDDEDEDEDDDGDENMNDNDNNNKNKSKKKDNEEKKYYEDPKLWRKVHFDWLQNENKDLWRFVCLYFFYRVHNYIPFYDIGYSFIKTKDDIIVKFYVYFIHMIHITYMIHIKKYRIILKLF